MSIAVTAVVKPSRSLSAMAACACIAVAAIGAAIVVAGGRSDPAFHPALGAICILFALFGARRVAGAGKTHRLDISDNGQIRLMETGPDNAYESGAGISQGRLVQLSGDSTLWSYLLILRLRPSDGAVVTVTVLPDSVTRDTFHALQVACLWLASRKNSAEEVNFSDF